MRRIIRRRERVHTRLNAARRSACVTALFICGFAATAGDKANYELASRWTASKVGKIVFDTSVTPHWLDTGDRFWYSYENNKGRRFYLVDPGRKTKALVFDPTRLAALLTSATGLPYD